MITIISRIFHYGLKNFWRNGWLSTVTTIIMTLALLVFVGLILFKVITNGAVVSIKDKIDISVYFKNTTSEDQILNIKQSLEDLVEVQSVSYISSDRALEIFKAKHSNDQIISQAINELNSNPLLASLSIKAKRPDQYASIDNYLNSPALVSYFDSISYAKNQVVIDRLTAIVNNVEKGGLALTFIFAFLSGLVVFNTIRLAIYSNREEIGMMRVVGASNSLVRGPFMVEGVLTGAIAAFLSLVLIMPVVYVVSPYLKAFVPSLDLSAYFQGHIFSFLLYQLLFGIGIGTISSFVAVRRYLKN